MLLNKEQIKQLIPHRDPMLLVDRIISYDLENQEIHAQYDVTKNWDVLGGHFPGNPIMPGVLVVEACAQASAVLTNLIDKKTSEDVLFYFAAIENIRFKAPVLPGNTLDMKIKIVKRKGAIIKSTAQAFVDGVLTTECAFTAKVIEK